MYIVTEIVNDNMNGNDIQISIINDSICFVFNGYSYDVRLDLVTKKINQQTTKIIKECTNTPQTEPS